MASQQPAGSWLKDTIGAIFPSAGGTQQLEPEERPATRRSDPGTAMEPQATDEPEHVVLSRPTRDPTIGTRSGMGRRHSGPEAGTVGRLVRHYERMGAGGEGGDVAVGGAQAGGIGTSAPSEISISSPTSAPGFSVTEPTPTAEHAAMPGIPPPQPPFPFDAEQAGAGEGGTGADRMIVSDSGRETTEGTPSTGEPSGLAFEAAAGMQPAPVVPAFEQQQPAAALPTPTDEAVAYPTAAEEPFIPPTSRSATPISPATPVGGEEHNALPVGEAASLPRYEPAAHLEPGTGARERQGEVRRVPTPELGPLAERPVTPEAYRQTAAELARMGSQAAPPSLPSIGMGRHPAAAPEVQEELPGPGIAVPRGDAGGLRLAGPMARPQEPDAYTQVASELARKESGAAPPALPIGREAAPGAGARTQDEVPGSGIAVPRGDRGLQGPAAVQTERPVTPEAYRQVAAQLARKESGAAPPALPIGREAPAPRMQDEPAAVFSRPITPEAREFLRAAENAAASGSAAPPRSFPGIQPSPTPPAHKIPAAELAPEAIDLAKLREAEPGMVKPVAHVVPAEELTPGREEVPAAAVRPGAVFAGGEGVGEGEGFGEEEVRYGGEERPEVGGRVRSLLTNLRSMTRDLAGLGEQVTYQEQPPQPAVDEEKEALKERVVRLAEIVEARTREVQDELLGREDRIRELELVAQQAHATSRRTVRTLQDLQRENRDLRAQASELDLAREQLRRARDEAEMLRGDMKEAQRVSGMLARDVEERTRVARELEDRLGQEMQTRRRILKDLDDAISERAELRQRLADKEIQLSRLSRAFDDQARESEQQVRDLNNLVREMQRRIRDVGRTLEDQAAYATPPRSRIPSGAESPAVPSARRIEYGERSSTPETPSPARSTPRRFTYEPQQQQPERDDRAPVSTPRPRYREYAAPPQREERSAWESGAFDYVRGGQRGPYYEPQVDTGSRGQQAQAPGGRPSSGRYEGPGRAPMPSPLRRLSEEEGYAGLGPQEVSREAKLSGGSVRTRTD